MFGSSGRASQPSSRLLAIPLILLVASLATLTGASSAHAEPAIELSPSEGMPGTHVEVTGSGFPLIAVVTLTFDGGNMDTEHAPVTTDAFGRFSATFWIPNSIDEGSYEVVAKSHVPLLPSTSASADFAVTAPNRAPSARSQTISIESNEEIAIALTGSDPDGDHITYSLVDQPQHGAINGFDPNAGTLTYVPETEYDGKDRFTFKVNDGKEDSFLGEVSIKILATDSGPRMEDTKVEVQEDGQVVISLDADDKGSSSLSFKIVDFPAHGTLGEIKPYDGDSAYVTYTPNPNFNGTDSFAAQASDTRFESEVATITVAVTPVQDPPTAQSAQLATRQDETLSVNLTGSDPDGDLLAYVIDSPPAHGTLAGSPPNLTYLPSSDYHGWDSFNFKVNDGKVDSAIARIEIKVEEVMSNADDGDSDNGAGSSGGSDSNSGANEPVEQQPVSPPPVTETPPAGEQVEEPAPTEESPLVPDSPPADEAVENEQQPSTPVEDAKDTTPPRLIFPASNLVFESQSEAGMTVNYNIAAIDESDGEVSPECSPPSGSKFPVGKVNVVCTATDSAGNKMLGSFALEVRLVAKGEGEPAGLRLDAPELQSLLLPAILAGAAGAAIFVGLKAAKKTRAQSSEPQKST